MFHQECVSHKPLKKLKGKEIHCSSESTSHLVGQDLKSVSTTAGIPCTKTLFFKWSWGETGDIFYVTLQNLKWLKDIKWIIIISENTVYQFKTLKCLTG